MIGVQEYAYGRQKVQGIIDFYSRRCDWEIHRNKLAQPFVSAKDLEEWTGDGIIGEIYTEESARLVQALKIPFVNTASTNLADQCSSVMLDNQKIGMMAAEHLISCKLDNFAFIGPAELWHVRQRFEGFSTTIERNGGHCIPLFFETGNFLEPGIPREVINPNRLKKLLKSVSLPVGIMASNDRVGFAVLEACRLMGLRAPEDVAVVGVDNDSMYCQLTQPSMTSIDSSAKQIGFSAAQLLDALMNGTVLNNEKLLISPGRVFPRSSTDTTRSNYPEVARALRFIRRHDHEFIDVSNILDIVPASRRWLELKFKEELGWGIYHEIRRVHVARAKKLLHTTEWPIGRIAVESGFKTQLQLDDAFRKLEGMTAREYQEAGKA
ncbi:MAG: DNA-binding transcriptional regulator [Kiritimatiellales bacterium]